jgi:hypothetical protein
VQTVTTTTTDTAGFKRWRFRSIDELRKACEEYTAMVDILLATRLGAEGGDGSDPDPDVMDAQYRLMAQNREIDRRLARLTLSSFTYARLIHWYYRKGSSIEADGWRAAAKRAGLPCARRMFRGKDMSREQFEVVLSLALRELFHTH